jgi:hypothetical protein
MAENPAALWPAVRLILLKLALAPLAVWLASVASKRYGHVIAGILSGFPMIAAPVTAALLFDQTGDQVASIAMATLSGLCASVVFIVTFAWVAAAHKTWWQCLALASMAFMAAATLLQWLGLAPIAAAALGCCAPWLAKAGMPKLALPTEKVSIPKAELTLRLIGATAMAAVLIFSAASTPAWLSGLLIAWPITGSILPCFTQRLSGPNATVALLSGFSRGLVGFSVFFAILAWLLPHQSKVMAYGLALLCAALTALVLARLAGQVPRT